MVIGQLVGRFLYSDALSTQTVCHECKTMNTVFIVISVCKIISGYVGVCLYQNKETTINYSFIYTFLF